MGVKSQFWVKHKCVGTSVSYGNVFQSSLEPTLSLKSQWLSACLINAVFLSWITLLAMSDSSVQQSNLVFTRYQYLCRIRVLRLRVNVVSRRRMLFCLRVYTSQALKTLKTWQIKYHNYVEFRLTFKSLEIFFYLNSNNIILYCVMKKNVHKVDFL